MSDRSLKRKLRRLLIELRFFRMKERKATTAEQRVQAVELQRECSLEILEAVEGRHAQ